MTGTVVFVAAVGIYTAAAAAVDLKLHRIPNWVTVPAAVLGIAYKTLAPIEQGWEAVGWGLLTSLAGLAVGFCLLLLPACLGGSGMGDVKLLAALGAWLGPILILVAFAVAIVVAALIALVIMLSNVMARGVSKTQRRFLYARRPTSKSGRKRPARVLPFAVPVAMSTWLLLAWIVTRGAV